MAHQIIGLRDAESGLHQSIAEASEPSTSRGGPAGSHHHAHHHSHGEAEAAARSAGVWLFVTLIGGLLVLTSYIVQAFSPLDQTGEYLYQFHMALAAGIGALLLAIRIIWHALKNLLVGQMHMDELVALAIVAAFATHDYRAAGVIGFFLLLSELVEARTAIGARASIEELIKLTPKTARLIHRDAGPSSDPPRLEVVDVKTLRKGQIVQVRPGENIPADGRVLEGDSTVNQAHITGESLPVDKRPGDTVFSGTTNLTGAIEVEVTKVGEETTLGQVQNLILQAERTRIPIMRLIDRYVVWYTPVILMLAALVLFFTRDSNGIQRAITMLVASCPCALIMATPTAMVAGLSCAARLGILIKDVSHLESAGRLTAVIFDKTGTLTTGVLSVTRLYPAEGVDGADLLRWAACSEQLSNHPAAQALMAVAEEANVPLQKPSTFEEVPGKGVIASFDPTPKSTHEQNRDPQKTDTLEKPVRVLVGRESFLKEHGVPITDQKIDSQKAETEGMSQLYVAANDRLLGMVGLEDRTRSAARGAVEELKAAGIRRIAMLTGDRQSVARRVALEMGCTEFKADCLPREKLDLVERMRSQGHRVMMVGDGVNDAPALAAGDLGLAMGAAGSDVAIKSASIALLNNDLTRIPFLIRLSRATRRVVVQNLVFGVLFVVTVVSLGAFNVIHPVIAAILHTASSFVVVFNSARLVRFGEDKVSQEQILAEDTSGRPVPAAA